MAEAFLNKHGHGHFEAESAGIEPGNLNPYVVKLMQETGIDLNGKKTQGVFDLFRQGRHYDAIITVCDAASAERCPVFPGQTKRISWSFEDPSSFQGSPEEILNNTRIIRNKIEKAVMDFIEEANNLKFWRK
jgi:arsenate reductase